MLTNGHEVSEHLTGVAIVGQTVDDRDRAVLGELLDFFLRIGTDHNTVKVTRQHACGILYGLTASDLQIARAEEERRAAEVVHTDLKGNTRSRRGFLEDHTERLSLENMMLDSVFLFIFELVGKIEGFGDLLLRPIHQFQ